MSQDLKFAIRSLLHERSFAAMVVVTLALGVGAATAIFSVVDAILLRPLPFPEAERLVVFNETRPRGRTGLSWPNYVDLRDRATLFVSVAAVQRTAFSVLEGGRARRVNGRFVSAAFLDVLREAPQLGRTFTPEDDRLGAAPVAIIGDAFWKRELGGDPGVLGRTLRTTEATFTIVGVLQPGFLYGSPDDILAPIAPRATPESAFAGRGNHSNLTGVARLKPGVRLEQARAELDAIAANLAETYPNTNSGGGAEVQPLRDRFVERVEPTLIALMGAVGFLLLLACANVANLLVARGAARQHELAIKTALGGTRWRVALQLLMESALLSLGGAALGVVVAAWFVRTLVALAPPETPRLDHVGINQMSLLFALAAAVTCGLVFGVFPAWHASGSRGEHLLARASRTSAAVAPRRTRRILMAVEVALAMVLLTGCGLMMRTMVRLAAVDPGFRTDHLLTARVALAGDAWASDERRLAYYERVRDAVRGLPGVTSAALTLSLPIEGSNWGSVFIVSNKPVPQRADLPSAAFIPITDGYFKTMGIAFKAGRDFDGRDGAKSAHVVVVNETFANRMWPGENPIGQRLKQGWPEDPNPWRDVVGVVGDVKLQGVDQDVPMQVFLPLAQDAPPSIAVVARTAVEPATLAAPLESAVQALESDVPVTRVLPMTSLMSNAVGIRRLSTVILMVFAGVAMLIAAVGLYGIVSHNVTERTREIGVRVALGAERRGILFLFIGQGLGITVAGAVAGIVGALGLARWLRQLVFGVEPTDPATLAGVAAILLAVAAIACYVPARRATKVDPIVALRAE